MIFKVCSDAQVRGKSKSELQMLKGREAILLETFQKVLDIKSAKSQVI